MRYINLYYITLHNAETKTYTNPNMNPYPKP